MKRLPATPEVLAVARRVVWFKEPSEAIDDPLHFMAHLMTFGTVEDLREMTRVVGTSEFLETLDHSPPGIFDPQSWTYWNLKFGRSPAPPLPERKFSTDKQPSGS